MVRPTKRQVRRPDTRPTSEPAAQLLPPALAMLAWWHWLLLGLAWIGAYVVMCAGRDAGALGEILQCGVTSAVVSGACFGSVAILALFFARGIRRAGGR
jgi:hypothetical protein